METIDKKKFKVLLKETYFKRATIYYNSDFYDRCLTVPIKSTFYYKDHSTFSLIEKSEVFKTFCHIHFSDIKKIELYKEFGLLNIALTLKGKSKIILHTLA